MSRVGKTVLEAGHSLRVDDYDVAHCSGRLQFVAPVGSDVEFFSSMGHYVVFYADVEHGLVG